ncbi:MAG: hypothetical protein Kow0068_02780 [Marinilabiliales bacterium]
MKKIIIIITIIASILTVTNSYSENDNKKIEINNSTTLSGKVIDKVTGEPLVGVQINIAELNLTTYTDFDGNFSFRNIQKGNYEISTNYISYKNYVFKNVNIKNINNFLKIELVNK